MPEQLQIIHDRTLQAKKEMSDLKKMFKEALDNNENYLKLKADLDIVRGKMKKISDSVKDDFSSEFNKIDTLKLDLEGDNSLMSDVALSNLTKGESSKVEDKFGNRYEAVFKAKFKKQ